MKNAREIKIIRAAIAAALAGIFLMVLQACVHHTPSVQDAPEDTAAKQKPETSGEVQTVSRYSDGRIGFIISEPADLSEEVADQFSRSVDAIAQEEYEEAVSLLMAVIDAVPDLSAPHINVARAYRKLGRIELAKEHLKKALELIPSHPLAAQEYSLILRHEGHFHEARDVYESSLAAFPEYLPMYRNLAILCDIYLNDEECAYRNFSEYNRQKPEDEDVSLWLSELKLRLGDRLQDMEVEQ